MKNGLHGNSIVMDYANKIASIANEKEEIGNHNYNVIFHRKIKFVVEEFRKK
jgi:hypothetical protein